MQKAKETPNLKKKKDFLFEASWRNREGKREKTEEREGREAGEGRAERNLQGSSGGNIQHGHPGDSVLRIWKVPGVSLKSLAQGKNLCRFVWWRGKETY